MKTLNSWPAPIALFAYNRLDHLKRTVLALAANELAEQSELIVYSDGPKDHADEVCIAEIRRWIPRIEGFRKVRMIAREQNLGLAESIITGVTETVSAAGQVIVVEDDIITSRWFLLFMNEALSAYADVDEVVSIGGYVFPVETPLPDTFLLRGADCWGWATWRRGWSVFNPDGAWLRAEVLRRGLVREFDFNYCAYNMRMLMDQIVSKNDSWAVRWYASTFLANKLSLYPGTPLIRNIGNDGSGRHCGTSTELQPEPSVSRIQPQPIPIEESVCARSAYTRYFRRRLGWRGRVRRFGRMVGIITA